MKEPSFDYDEDADVMYITFGEPQQCTAFEDQPGIVVRYTLSDELNGITIIDYSKRVDRSK